jgi:cardiolipin synthase
MLHPACGWPEQLHRLRRRFLIALGLIALAAVPVFIFALVGVPHVIRRPIVRTVVAGALDMDRIAPDQPGFGRTVELLTGARLVTGNHVEVLANGDGTFPRLWADLRDARRSITMQMYYIAPGMVTDSIAALLAARARAGLEVRFLYDAFGAAALPTRVLDSLHAAGVRTAEFRPLRWYALDRANHRSHVRGVVIDGRIGYTGGFGLDDKWLGSGRAPMEWRETNVRFTGPTVASMQAVFVAKWAEATGELLASQAAADGFTNDDAAVAPSTADAALLYSPSVVGSTTAERLLALSIAAARQRLYITNAYFVPQTDFVALLTAAAHRGVDVRILTNGPESDVESTRLAGHRQYLALLAAGVRIWEYQPTTIHAKTLVVDGLWSSVSTANFDNRSLAYNAEVAFVALDRRIGTTLESLFLDDLRWAAEVNLATFKRRSWIMRARERIAGFVEAIL